MEEPHILAKSRPTLASLPFALCVVFGSISFCLLYTAVRATFIRPYYESHPPIVPCMSLTDPTVVFDARNHPLPIFEASDPEASALLSRYDPPGAYLQHNNNILLTELSHQDFQRCHSGDAYAFTPFQYPAIFLDRDRENTPALRAAAISHELVHVAHQRGFPLHNHSWVRHLLFSEEAEAHYNNLFFTLTLHTPSLGNPVGQVVCQMFPFEFGLVALYLCIYFLRKDLSRHVLPQRSQDLPNVQ